MKIIDADALFEAGAILIPTKYYEGVRIVIDAIRNAPTVEAEPIKHGRWVIEPDAIVMHCSVCGWAFEYYSGLEEEWNNCPHCGSIMDEVEE